MSAGAYSTDCAKSGTWHWKAHACTQPAVASLNLCAAPCPTTDAGGCCDCGDMSSWRPQGCCPRHRCVLVPVPDSGCADLRRDATFTAALQVLRWLALRVSLLSAGLQARATVLPRSPSCRLLMMWWHVPWLAAPWPPCSWHWKVRFWAGEAPSWAAFGCQEAGNACRATGKYCEQPGCRAAPANAPLLVPLLHLQPAWRGRSHLPGIPLVTSARRPPWSSCAGWCSWARRRRCGASSARSFRRQPCPQQPSALPPHWWPPLACRARRRRWPACCSSSARCCWARWARCCRCRVLRTPFTRRAARCRCWAASLSATHCSTGSSPRCCSWMGAWWR